jgi:uncharacterized protein YjiS (DUF1127 family)
MRIFILLTSAATAYISVNKDGDREIRRQSDRDQKNSKDTDMNIIASYKTWRKYRETYKELARLNNRELADLGIHRGEIERVAKQAVGY